MHLRERDSSATENDMHDSDGFVSLTRARQLTSPTNVHANPVSVADIPPKRPDDNVAQPRSSCNAQHHAHRSRESLDYFQ